MRVLVIVHNSHGKETNRHHTTLAEFIEDNRASYDATELEHLEAGIRCQYLTGCYHYRLPMQGAAYCEIVPAPMTSTEHALSNALNMLRVVANGGSFDTTDFFDRVNELECALDPTLKPGDALRKFTDRTPYRAAPLGWQSVET